MSDPRSNEDHFRDLFSQAGDRSPGVAPDLIGDIHRGHRERRARQGLVGVTALVAIVIGLSGANGYLTSSARPAQLLPATQAPTTPMPVTTTPTSGNTTGARPAAVDPTPVGPTMQTPPTELSASHVPPQTSRAPGATQSSAPAAAPLRFTFDVGVSGRTITVGGRWTGVDRALTASQIAGGKALSTGSEAGSGVEGFDGDITGAHSGIFAQTNGEILTCAGAAVAQTRTLPTQTITLPKPGTYQLIMHTYSCSGERNDMATFTVR